MIFDDFPQGKDHFLSRYWIINAIDCGSFLSVKWMLSKNVDLDFTDEEGSTVLSSAIKREKNDRYEIMEQFLKQGAPDEHLDTST